MEVVITIKAIIHKWVESNVIEFLEVQLKKEENMATKYAKLYKEEPLPSYLKELEIHKRTSEVLWYCISEIKHKIGGLII